MNEMKSLTLNGKKYDCFVDQLARELAAASAVIKSATGESISLTDASDVNLYGLRIFGKTTQDGTPTPNTPVEMVSVGNSGSIILSVTGADEAQSLVVSTPDGLPGIPVDTGGNYTDANGQQWVCNEIDFERGKLIVRVFSEEITETIQFVETPDWPGRFVSNNCLSVFGKTGRDNALSNFAKYEPWGYGYNGESFAINSRSLYYTPETEMTVDEVNEMFVDMIASETPPVVVGQLAEPIEIDLTEGTLAAYADLRTYRNSTTVSNDASAHMELEYVMDAKKYIDSLMAGGIHPATVE